MNHGVQAQLRLLPMPQSSKGDAAAEELHLSHPDWLLVPVSWAAAAMLTRRALLDRAVADDLAVLAFHLPFPGLGTVVAEGDGWNWMPIT
ncbi:hypothetical protein BH23CHL5_BH23CHL5_22480 [soil metagenome]